MPIPYMGSKQRSAGKIYQTIKNLNPEATTICDLFCGGFAIGEFFLRNDWQLIANDKNKYVVALINQVINIGLDEKKCLKWVTRELFLHIKENPGSYENWYIGYVQSVWSFGNNQKFYLYGKKIESYKKAGHNLVIDCDPDLILQLAPDLSKKYIEAIIKQKSWSVRRISLSRVTKLFKKRIPELERQQHLERLEKLQQLERNKKIQKVKLSSLSYEQVEIPSNCIIYCDPPYQGTTEYAEGGFDHDKFWDWAREKSKTHKVYISEYNAPDDFELILRFEQNSTLSSGSKTDTQPECLFRIKS